MEKEIRLSDNRLLRIMQSSIPECPREWDNFGTMACFHKRYDLGDKNIPFHSDDFSSWEEMEKYIKEELQAVVILPLYLYDHGGITMATTSFSCRWDSGQVGYIYATKDKIKQEYGIKKISKNYLEKVEKLLEAEVKTYDQYLTGDVYGFELVKLSKCDQGHEHEEEIDSCWGFYGSNFNENGLFDHIDLTKEDLKAIDAL
jgi:hypothetical protein